MIQSSYVTQSQVLSKLYVGYSNGSVIRMDIRAHIYRENTSPVIKHSFNAPLIRAEEQFIEVIVE